MPWRRTMKATTYPARVSDINLIHSATRNRWIHTLAFMCRDEYMTCRGKAESFRTVTQQYPKKHSAQWHSYRLRTAGVTAIELINMYVLDLVVSKQMITEKWNANETTRQERKTQWCLARMSIGSSTFSLCLRKAVCCTIELKSAKVTQRWSLVLKIWPLPMLIFEFLFYLRCLHVYMSVTIESL